MAELAPLGRRNNNFKGGGVMAAERWSKASQNLHHLSILMIAGLVAVGLTMTGLDPADPLRRYAGLAHSLGGVSLALLTLWRVVLRLRRPAPEALPLPALHRRGMEAVHWLIYAATFAVALSGKGLGLTSEWPAYMRGMLPAAPDLSALLLRQVHEHAVHVLIVLIGIHVLGVAVNELRHGRTLRRMFGWMS
jgi:cytochrome b561